MDGWLDVCAVHDIPLRGARVLHTGAAVPVALFRTAADRVFAIADRCPHRGGPLSQGLVTGARVVCPLHGWSIELASGTAVAPDQGSVQTFEVDVRDGRVHLRADRRSTERSPRCSGNAIAGSGACDVACPRVADEADVAAGAPSQRTATRTGSRSSVDRDAA